MLPSLTRRALCVATLACAALQVAPAQAQTYPTKPVRVIVSFSTGGTTDILARYLSQKLGESLGQTFVVDNKPGAGGILGNDIVAKAAADGHTLLLGSASSLAVNVSMYKSFPYDPHKDFAPIMQVASGPFVIVVNPRVPANNLRELIALIKSKPGQINFGSSGNGTSIHLTGELLNSMAGMQMKHVPYKGTGPAMLDTIAGHVEITLSDMVPFVPHIATGKLRAIAQTTARRSALLPDLPAVSETVPGYDATSWYGMVAPAATPAPIIQKLHAELTRIMQQADVKTRYAQLGVEPVANSPEQFRVFLANEIVKWADVVKKSGATIE